MAETKQSVLIPGDLIGPQNPTHVAGSGTYSMNGRIFASVTGVLQSTTADDKVYYQVTNENLQNRVPNVGDVVTAQVTNVNPRFCKCRISAVEGVSLRDSYRGMIRKEDVRATERDKVELHKCFRPGDVILARVLSLGDSQAFLLTTGENELGVFLATSEAGNRLVPVSWCEMQCPVTGIKEQRKVAKIRPQQISSNSSAME